MGVTQRVFTQVLLPFLILGLPTMGATLGGSAIHIRESHGVMEGSDGGFLAFLSNAKSSVSMFGSYESSPTALFPESVSHSRGRTTRWVTVLLYLPYRPIVLMS
ncbi:hypothetical protein HD554DRAFT_2133964 [Boletus coccyginus]|nr:hypothetical protein HD554DRAFT_2133964 [Boletus coccyginus]